MTDELTQLVRAFGEAAFNDPGEKQLPMATADATEVIKAQLTTNTGTHFLDSGGAYGRHWEENQDDPPWEQPAWNVDHGFVTNNVYHYMDRHLDRNRACVALEAALHAYSFSDDRKRDPWLRCQEEFAESLLSGNVTASILRTLGLPDVFIEDVLGVQAELRSERAAANEPATINTYNGEFHGLSQVLQGTNLGGPYADYVFLQVHQGADVRGGYTGPRVYEVWDCWIPGELSFYCEQCEWTDAESCIYGSDDLLYQRTVDPFELEEEGWIEEGDEELPALSAAYDADQIDGAVFHKCRDEPGHVGHVVF